MPGKLSGKDRKSLAKMAKGGCQKYFGSADNHDCIDLGFKLCPNCDARVTLGIKPVRRNGILLYYNWRSEIWQIEKP